MKKSVISLLVMMIVALSVVSAQSVNSCEISVKMLNQDPYPAVPNDKVKVVFQVDGVEDPVCGDVSLTFVEEFPFSLEPGAELTQEIRAGTFSSFEFNSFWLVPFEVIVDPAALDEENPLKVVVAASGGESEILEFNVTVENVVADFEVSIKEYDMTTGIVTFEILNIGEADVEALAVDIPKQTSFEVKGSMRNIVGSLDSNDDTTFTFEGFPSDGQVTLEISYTDAINVRRTIEKTVEFDSSYYTGRARDAQQGPNTGLIVLGIVVVVVVIWLWRRSVNRKRRMKK